MPFPFLLPTPSSLSFQNFADSSSHPSLPLAASTNRAAFRSVLKRYQKATPQGKSGDLSQVLAALQDYLPYLIAVNAGSQGRKVNGQEVDISIRAEPAFRWRSTLASRVPGKSSTRVRGKGLTFEICFVLTTLGFIYNAQARAQLHALYAKISPTAEQRTSLITAATKLLIDANSVHTYLNSLCVETDASSAVVEALSQTQGGLAALAMAEATLLAVLKDDPYPAVIAQDRNKHDKEWMIKPPEIPKVRAHLFARLCLAASEHAGKAEAMLSASGRVDEDVLKYVSNLRRTSRARACRFFGIDAELGGDMGKGIAWLAGGKKQLGFTRPEDESSKLRGIAKLKKDWSERKEDKKIEKGGDWGGDAGRFEELRIIEMLEQKWNKMNDTACT